ncbi:response regulator [Halopseudomonas salina]|uniref:DNA-binding response regulator n=1 Tax=Halopseudomonas salina TaxID=1323744 RepID=A0ABQ1NWP8_9GAMM|nr:response regulator [Halopseudomonas salina]GGC86131.1 DNA-binding response regulator [Halopseudomonas salina]
MHILLVEDDPLIASGIAAGLAAQGMTVDPVGTAAHAEAMLGTIAFDVMILDLGLPDEDGLLLLRRLRAREVTIPVLVLTARDAVSDRVAGLQAGADDYLVKPFDLRELSARLHAMLRRASGRSSNLIRHGVLVYDPDAALAWVNDTPVELSRRERALLSTLLLNKGRVLTAGQLKDSIYGMSDELESNALNVHIHHLRRKLGNDIVETVRGLGYRLGAAAPVDPPLSGSRQ